MKIDPKDFAILSHLWSALAKIGSIKRESFPYQSQLGTTLHR